MKIFGLKAVPALTLGVVGAFGGIAHAAPSVVVTWNQAALEEVRRGRLGPPIVARALHVAHACMYDAWTGYDRRALPVASTVARRPVVEHTQANKAKAVSFAAHRCLSNLFPAGAARLDATLRTLGYDPVDTSTDPATPQGIGNAAAAAVIASRRFDGSNQYGDLAPGAYADTTGFVPANAPMGFCLPLSSSCTLNISTPYAWQPLTNNLGVVQTYIAPHWTNVTPFALTSSNQFDLHPQVAMGPNYLQGPARYNADMDEILRISGGLTEQQKLIVEYWADGPESELPPGHWALFAQHVSLRDGNSIDQDVKMFFAMHAASHDAGIVGWHLKRRFQGVRPITGIRHFRNGQTVFAWGGPGQPNQWIDAGKWTPYNPGSNLTPAFPGFVSGHSTFSAASATVLRAFTGSDALGFSTVIPANFGRVEPGVPAVPTTLSYPTFSSAVADAGLSRLYAGIHYSDDNTVGQLLGNLTGQQAWSRARYMFEGGLSAGTSSQASSGYTSSLSWSHTTEDKDKRVLVVGVTTTDATSVRSVTYGGLPLTRLAAQADTRNDNRAELWYLVAPPVGQRTVNVRLSSGNDVVAGAVAFSGVHQSQPFGTARTAASESRSACLTLANEPAPLVASVLASNGDAGAVTASNGASSLVRWQGQSGYGWLQGSDDVIGTGMVSVGAPVANICQTLANAKRWSMVGVPLKAAY